MTHSGKFPWTIQWFCINSTLSSCHALDKLVSIACVQECCKVTITTHTSGVCLQWFPEHWKSLSWPQTSTIYLIKILQKILGKKLSLVWLAHDLQLQLIVVLSNMYSPVLTQLQILLNWSCCYKILANLVSPLPPKNELYYDIRGDFTGYAFDHLLHILKINIVHTLAKN